MNSKVCRPLAQTLATEMSLQSSLSNFVSTFIGALQGINELYVGSLFNGSSTSAANLAGLLEGGKWVSGAFANTDLYNMDAIVSQALYSQLIVQAWTLSPWIHPALM